MQRRIFELTEAESRAVIGGARLPVSPYQSAFSAARQPASPAASPAPASLPIGARSA